MTDRQCLTIGTSKGLFVLTSDDDRTEWNVTGPFCGGWPINHVTADMATGRIWAVGGNPWFGAGIWSSTDSGATWSLTKLSNGEMDAFLAKNPEMAAVFGVEAAADAPFSGKLDALWSIARTGTTLYAGGKPGVLFSSRDDGKTWEIVDGLVNHPTRDEWEPGGAGLTLHSIVTDPDDANKVWVGISAAGVFASEDGGQTWERRNRRSNEDAFADHGHQHGPGDHSVDGHHETGLCVHNFVRASAAPQGLGDLLYQQNHHGVFRSPDGGRSWHDISAGLPSTFGFPIAVHPRDPEKIWVMPLNGDSIGRYPPDASAAIWASSDGGDNWSRKQSGLPAKNCYFTVLRQAMTTDRASPVGVYFGTNSGSVFLSPDEGENWNEIARHLPTVLCVEVFAAT